MIGSTAMTMPGRKGAHRVAHVVHAHADEMSGAGGPLMAEAPFLVDARADLAGLRAGGPGRIAAMIAFCASRAH